MSTMEKNRGSLKSAESQKTSMMQDGMSGAAGMETMNQVPGSSMTIEETMSVINEIEHDDPIFESCILKPSTIK